MARLRQRCRTDKCRTTVSVWNITELGQEEIQVGLVIAMPACPPGRENSRRSTQDIHCQPGIVSDSHQACCLRHGTGFEQGVLGKRDAGFSNVRATHGGCVHHLGINIQPWYLIPQKLTQLPQLSRVVSCKNQARPGSLGWAHRVSARVSRWMAASWVVPSSARSRSLFSSSRSKGAPSAVPWTSTNLPVPVTTTFMSVSARTSST